MLIYATSCFVYFVAIVFDSFVVMFYAYNIEIAIDNFVHWSFCYTYLKLSVEVKYMFDRRIYTNDPIVM